MRTAVPILVVVVAEDEAEGGEALEEEEANILVFSLPRMSAVSPMVHPLRPLRCLLIPPSLHLPSPISLPSAFRVYVLM